jgi:hypothetical protein
MGMNHAAEHRRDNQESQIPLIAIGLAGVFRWPCKSILNSHLS